MTIAIAALSGCGSAVDPTPEAEAITKATFDNATTVEAVGTGYSTNSVEVTAGEGIEFVNADTENRSFQGRVDGQVVFDSGLQMPGDRFVFRATGTGPITVTDRFDDEATLTITVAEAATTP